MNPRFLFVGKSSQSKLISKVLHGLGYLDQVSIKELNTSEFLTLSHSELCRFPGIFIVNRDSDHEKSLRHLINTKYIGYIFLEKPIFQNSEFENVIQHFNPSKTYVNLPMRYTNLFRVMSQIYEDLKLGKLLHSRIQISYGIAFKDGFASNWRFSRESNPFGVVSTLGIHFVDLFRRLLGEIHESRIIPIHGDNSNKESGILTSELLLKFKSSVASILLSYESPYQFSGNLTFTNALIEFDDDKFQIYYPRDTFDDLGRFRRPPVSETLQMQVLDWDKALENSIEYFMKVVLNSGNFESTDWNVAVQVNRTVCNLKILESKQRS